MSRSGELFARARTVVPGGVNSPVRAFKSVGGTPYFVARGEGPYVWDVEGNRLIDLVQSYGAEFAKALTDVGAKTPEDLFGGRRYIVGELYHQMI